MKKWLWGLGWGRIDRRFVLILVLVLVVHLCELFFVHNWFTNGYTGHHIHVEYRQGTTMLHKTFQSSQFIKVINVPHPPHTCSG